MPRWQTSGLSAVDRFWYYVQKADGCWLWGGRRNNGGYGRFWADGRECSAAVYSLELTSGEFSRGRRALHRCDNPPCVRPDHLFWGTQLDNMRDKIAKGRRVLAINEGIPTFKLTGAQVAELRRLEGTATHTVLGQRFGVHQSTVSRIFAGLKRKRGDVGTHIVGV
jgi:hypothetical protein